MLSLRVSTISFIFFVFTRDSVTVFAALRTYAIWDKDLRVFFGILIPGLVFPAGYIVSHRLDFDFVVNLSGHDPVSLHTDNILRKRALASYRLRSLCDLTRK